MYFVYIISNQNNTTLYVGVTRDINKRIYEHKFKVNNGFSKKYNLTKLLYYEEYSSPYDAIRREKQLKAGSRLKKIKVITSENPGFIDLAKAWKLF